MRSFTIIKEHIFTLDNWQHLRKAEYWKNYKTFKSYPAKNPITVCASQSMRPKDIFICVQLSL